MNSPFRFSTLMVAGLALVVLLIAPVVAAPALHEGKRTSYDLAASIKFSHSCSALSGTVCPMIAMIPTNIDVAGTVSWLDTRLTQSTADLNVSRDITISFGDIVPASHNVGTVKESVDLASRVITLQHAPFPELGLDQILSAANAPIMSSLSAGGNWSSVLAMLKDTMKPRSAYTIWWVNGPLEDKDTVPVLFLSTMVKSKKTVPSGNLGPRSAWSLTYNFTKFDPQIMITAGSTNLAGWYGYSLKVGFVFNYDEKNDILLSASADIQADFHSTISILCKLSSGCPSTGKIPAMTDLSVSVHSSLKLASTNIALNERLTATLPTSSDSSTSSGVTDSSTSSVATSGTQNHHPADTQSGTGSQPASNPSVRSNNSQTPSPAILSIPSFAAALWALLLAATVGAITIGTIGVLRARKRSR